MADKDPTLEAIWLRKKREVEGAVSPKAIFLIGVGAGIQIERGRAVDEKVNSVLAKISEVSGDV
jgi:hypothetical protein